jgi:UDP-2-acetamido-2,6-beta-L-arabino-hexul-4-ose reductase
MSNKYRLNYQKDERGWSLEVFKSNYPDFNAAYLYLINSKPGTTRGNHFHKRKRELLCVIQGRARFTLLDKNTAKREEFDVQGNEPTVVQIPTNTVHAIENIGDEDLLIVEVATEVYNEKDPDTFKEVITKQRV